ncbi:hypothetical protein PsorP6_017586 [Peronosclerospora sorghi]|uniref:Uncharacterized protein n=1 Tax=Peronosclerospora sorghi TaxID=230839 RepID=A0ACC0WKU6_9STRA|nr:hypothetical protein PsorP6_017586 [Peronosclerospora sorghi]
MLETAFAGVTTTTTTSLAKKLTGLARGVCGTEAALRHELIQTRREKQALEALIAQQVRGGDVGCVLAERRTTQLEDFRAVVWQYERHVDTLERERCMLTHETRQLEDERNEIEAQVAASSGTSRMLKQALDEKEHERRALVERGEADRRRMSELERQCKEGGGEDWTTRDAHEFETRAGHVVTARNVEEQQANGADSDTTRGRERTEEEKHLEGATQVEHDPVDREHVEAVDRTTGAWLESQAVRATQAQNASQRFKRLHEQCESLETQLLSMEDRRLARIEFQTLGGGGMQQVERLLPEVHARLQAIHDGLTLCALHADRLLTLCAGLEATEASETHERAIVATAVRLLRFAFELHGRVTHEATAGTALAQRVLDALAQWYEDRSDGNASPTPSFPITSRETALILQNWIDGGPQGLDSSNPKVRSAAILAKRHILAARSRVASHLESQELEASVSETVKAAFEKAVYDPAKAQASAKRRVKDQEDAAPSRDDAAALFGRVDVSSHVDQGALG